MKTNTACLSCTAGANVGKRLYTALVQVQVQVKQTSESLGTTECILPAKKKVASFVWCT